MRYSTIYGLIVAMAVWALIALAAMVLLGKYVFPPEQIKQREYLESIVCTLG